MRKIGITIALLTVVLAHSVLAAAPTAGTWQQLANSPYGVSPLLMTDGTLISFSGRNCYRLTPDSSGNYANGTWSTLASMNDSHDAGGSVVLPDGRVMMLGGEFGNMSTVELYDPTTNTWKYSGYVPSIISDGTAKVTADGKSVLVAAQYSFMIYDIANDRFRITSAFDQNIFRECSWVQLPDASFLVLQDLHNVGYRYLPWSDQMVNAGTSPVAIGGVTYPGSISEMGPALLCYDGRALFLGANDYSNNFSTPGHTAFYSPGTNSWQAGPDIPNGPTGNVLDCADQHAVMMPNGHALLATDYQGGSAATVFEFDPFTQTFTDVTPPMYSGSYYPGMLTLPSGQVYFSGGYIYTPVGNPDPAWRPSISSVSANSDGSYKLMGTQLNGLTEGGQMGDEWQQATNYPIVRLVSGNNVYYGRTFNHSSMGVATGSTPVSTNFTVAGIPNGSYSLYVVASGVASAAFPFTVGGGGGNAPVITSATSASGTVGSAFSYTITATNNPTSFNATGLPSGLSVNTSTGAISGTPSAPGTSNVTLSATNGNGPGTATLTLTISSSTPMTLTASPTTVSAGGTVTATWSNVSGPTAKDWIGIYAVGASVNSGGLASGQGTQWKYTNGAASGNLTLTAPNAAGQYELRYYYDDTYSLLKTSNQITVGSANTPPIITSAATATPAVASVGQNVSFVVGASDSDGDTLSYSWAFGDGGTGTGASATHSYSNAGTYSAVVTVSDGHGNSVTSAVSVTVNGGGTLTLSASPTTVAPGDTITISWSGAANPTATDWIGIYVPGTADNTLGSSGRGTLWQYTNGAASGSVTLPAPSTAGQYEFRYFFNNGYTKLATSNTITVGSGGSLTLSASPTTVAPGDTITISWSGAANPTATDWIGIYVPGTADNTLGSSGRGTLWQYTNGAASGSVTLPAPSTAGQYEFRYFFNDGYTKLATSNSITVSGSSGTSVAHINFQPASAAVPSGYQMDDGSPFTNARGYGWNAMLGSRQRGVNSDARLDTFVFSSSAATWTYNIANGSYLVTLACGDPSYSQGPQSVTVQGTVAVNNVTTSPNQFANVTDMPVTVSNGQLTVTIGGGSGNTILNYIDIKSATATSAPSVGLSAATLSAAPASLTVQKLAGMVSFNAKGRDTALLAGTISGLPSVAKLSGATVKVWIGGEQGVFKLDGKGHGKSSSGALSLSSSGAINVALKGATWSQPLSDAGIDPSATRANGKLKVNVMLSINGAFYSSEVNTVLSSKAHVGGKFHN